MATWNEQSWAAFGHSGSNSAELAAGAQRSLQTCSPNEFSSMFPSISLAARPAESSRASMYSFARPTARFGSMSSSFAQHIFITSSPFVQHLFITCSITSSSFLHRRFAICFSSFAQHAPASFSIVQYLLFNFQRVELEDGSGAFRRRDGGPVFMRRLAKQTALAHRTPTSALSRAWLASRGQG